MNKTAVILTNYNMPERTDAICEHLYKTSNSDSFDLVVVDNGSDLVPPSSYTNVYLTVNRQVMGGWLAGYNYARRTNTYDSYIFTITSIEFPTSNSHNPIDRLRDIRSIWDNTVILSPTLTLDSTTAWNHMKKTTGYGVRKTWMVDNLFTMYDAKWFDEHGGFDDRMIYGWGPDLEMSYLARTENKRILLDEETQIKKVTNIGYHMNRMNMEANERENRARENMTDIFVSKYGPKWKSLMRPDIYGLF